MRQEQYHQGKEERPRDYQNRVPQQAAAIVGPQPLGQMILMGRPSVRKSNMVPSTQN
jgi:hypothetical protein